MATVQNEKTPPFLKKITEWDEGGQKEEVKFILGNGQEVVVKVLAEVSDENFYHAAVHGISQRLGDSCSAFSKDKDYASAYESLTALRDQLKTKEWSREREKGGGRQQIEDLIQALAKIKKQPEEVCRMAVEKATPETLKKWSGNATVAAEMADIKARRLKVAAKQAVEEIDLGI